MTWSKVGDHRTPAALDADRRIRPDALVHLESASFLAADRNPGKRHRCSSAAPDYLIKTGTSPLVKARSGFIEQ
jgi:hypothetical protein